MPGHQAINSTVKVMLLLNHDGIEGLCNTSDGVKREYHHFVLIASLRARETSKEGL